MDFLGTIFSCVLNTVANPIMKHVKYPFTAGGNTKDLDSAAADLRAQKNDVKEKIRDAARENGVATHEALHWLSQVENLEQEAEGIKQKYQQLCRCFCNICPNVWSVYKISKMAANKLVEANSLRDERKPSPDQITRVQQPLHRVMPTPSSESPYLKSAIRYVREDEHGIIGICGMGGVGKTHLMKEINEQLNQPSAEFEVVVFLKCKQCTNETIQNEIIDWLGLDKNGSMEQKQSTICNFLINRNFVLLLDDLWSYIDLSIIGIPDPKNTAGMHKQKVVLATRLRGLCGQMEVQKTIEVNLLEGEDAWSLFEKMATTETINSHPLIKNSAVQIVNELCGLPLAIIAVGKTMRPKRQHGEWEHALAQLQKARLNDVESQNTDEQLVFSILKFSYDSLRNGTLKDCFLHCSLWPEGFEIPKDKLIELWMGLGLIDEPDIQTAYNVGFSYIGELKAASLLEGGDDENFIKMHDVMRDMALWITKDKWIVQAGATTNTGSVTMSVSHGAEKLSAMKTGATKFSFSSQHSSIKPTSLMLNHNHLNSSITLPLELFSLLTILDLSYNNLGEFPVDICKLVHLQFLNLSHNGINFGLLPAQLGNLTELKYLLLRGLSCVFPKGVLVKLKALRVLDCSHSSFIYGNHNNEMLFSTLGEIQSLTFFQALGISLWDMQDIADFCEKVSVPVRWLDVSGHKGSCLTFSTRFLGGSQFSNFLFSIDVKETEVKDVKFELDQSTGQNQSSCHLHRLEYLHFRKMWRMENVIWKNLNPKDVFPRLLVLEFEICPMLSSISWVVNLPCIQELRVIQCNNLKQLICIDEQNTRGINVSRYDVPLKKMHLGQNYGLQSISDPMVITFGALEILEVYDCDALKKLPFNTGDPPKKLKKIRGPEKWWTEVEMEDGSHRSLLRPFFEKLW
ncbi:hypothetical protein LUZ63_012972 [Rhynchospora breviuscula]|uniref:AAA+ ATPase domain-containing protein n=1 Tax=Rhynchospora breviuscula TaxID=2022672 RepID=A0A9Q0C7N3_9POAL|nr:hypothetical protein LUZ63_012972 [Rhynchospora breviuscula]